MFIQASRRGVDFAALQKQETEEKKEHIIATTNRLGSTLADRQNNSAEKASELLQDIREMEHFLGPEAQHLDALNKRMEGLNAALKLSQTRNTSTQADWEQRRSEMKEVLQLLAELKKTTQSVPGTESK
jgi:chromosome segregation ATPase